MLIKFACKCGKKLQADEKYAGRKAPCPQCGAAITVPPAEPSDAIAPARGAAGAAVTPEADTYEIAQEPARPDRNDSRNTLPAPLTVTSAAVRSRTALVPQTSRLRLGHRARGKGPLLPYVGIGGLLLTVITIGVTLWATGLLSKPEGEPEQQADKSQVASSAPDATHTAVRKAEAAQADSFQAIYREGQKLLDDGELEQAAATFDKAIQCKPDAAMAYNARGVAYLRQNRRGRALSDFNEAIRLDPTLPKYYANRALVYREQDNYGLALADHNKCIELSPNTGEYYKERGETYYFMDKKAEAESDYATAKRLDEKTPARRSETAPTIGKAASKPKTTANGNPPAVAPPSPAQMARLSKTDQLAKTESRVSEIRDEYGKKIAELQANRKTLEAEKKRLDAKKKKSKGDLVRAREIVDEELSLSTEAAKMGEERDQKVRKLYNEYSTATGQEPLYVDAGWGKLESREELAAREKDRKQREEVAQISGTPRLAADNHIKTLLGNGTLRQAAYVREQFVTPGPQRSSMDRALGQAFGVGGGGGIGPIADPTKWKAVYYRVMYVSRAGLLIEKDAYVLTFRKENARVIGPRVIGPGAGPEDGAVWGVEGLYIDGVTE